MILCLKRWLQKRGLMVAFLPLRLKCDQWCMWHWHMITGWLMAERQWLSCVRSRLWWRILACCCLTCRGQQHHPIQQSKDAVPADRTEDIQESAGFHSSLFLFFSLNGRGCFEMNPRVVCHPLFLYLQVMGSPSSPGQTSNCYRLLWDSLQFSLQVDLASLFFWHYWGSKLLG